MIYVENLSMITPFGMTEETWKHICNNEVAYDRITRFETDLGLSSRYIRSKIAGEVKFDPDYHPIINEMDKDRLPEYQQWALALADNLIKDYDLPKGRTAVLVSPGLSIYIESIDANRDNRDNSYTFCSNMTAHNINIKYGFTGPSAMTMTACSTGMYSIILGCMLLETNQADYVIAGSVDQSVSFHSIKQMCKLRALSTKYNDTPNIASRPWDTKRDGLVMSEGGALFLLAKEKTNNTLCEIAGYSMNNDAYQVVAPHPDGTQIAKCMEDLVNKTCKPDLINAHATSTPMGDYIEIDAINRIGLGDIPITANKSQLGHAMGAAGSIESALSVLSIKNNTITPSINIDNIEEGYSINYSKVSENKNISTVLCNSFGFGGTNASIMFRG